MGVAVFTYTSTAIGGGPESGALVYAFTKGTTTPAVCFSDSGLSIPTLNPVVSDADGRSGAIYFDDTKSLTFRVKTADGATTLLQVDFEDGVFSATYAQIEQLTLFEEDDTADGAQTHVLSGVAVDNPWSVRVMFDGDEQPVANYSVVTDGTDTTVTYATNCQPALGVRVLYKSAVLQALSPAAIDYSAIDISDANVDSDGTLVGDIRGFLIGDAIANGETDQAPTQNAVFDALALKLTSAGGDGSAVVVTAAGGSAARSLAAMFAEVINVLDYGAVGDCVLSADGSSVTSGTDDTAAIAAAYVVAKSTGKPLYFPPGKKYRITATLGTNENSANVAFLGLDPETTVIVQDFGSSTNPLIQFVGGLIALASAPAITSSAAHNTRQVAIADTSGWTAGDFAWMHDASQPVINYEDGSTICDTGELVRIREVVNGTTLNLWGALTFDYTTSTKLRRFSTLINGFKAENLTFHYVGSADSQGLTMFGVRNFITRNCRFRRYNGDCIRLSRSFDFEVSDTQFLDLNNTSPYTPYGVFPTDGTCKGRISNCFQRGGRHLASPTSSADDIESYDIVISGCVVTDTSEAGLDTHPGSRHISIIGNNISSAARDTGDVLGTAGIQIRGRWTTVADNQISANEEGIRLVYGEKNVVKDNLIRGCDIGIRVQESPGAKVEGNEIFDPTTIGIELDTNGDAMADLRLVRNTVYGNPSTAAYVADTWKTSWVAEGNTAPDATTLRSGWPIYVFKPQGEFYVVASSAVAVSHTGNTSKTALATVAIPGGSLGANGRLRVTCHYSMTASTNSKTVSWEYGGSAFLQRAENGATIAAIRDQREMCNRNSASSQVSWRLSSHGGFGGGTAATTTGSVDSTADQNLIFYTTNANSGETVTLENYCVEALYAA